MTWVLKVRGSPGLKCVEYLCPIHGRFEMTIADPPDEMSCPDGCGLRSPWVISSPLTRVNPIEAVKGKWTKPERKTYTDTRNLGEGQPLHEWREDRAKIWEEKRKEDVVRFAREHNERVRGD